MISLRYKVIALDFDGVLVESNTIKDEAFEYVFRAFPEHMPEILEYHHRTSIIRFRKFEHIYTQILRKTYSKEIEAQLAKRFSEYCVNAVIRCPWVKGAKEFLDFFQSKVPLYLVSINPAHDLEVILKGRGISGKFKKVYAVDGAKAEALDDILRRENIKPNELVFIGDSAGDYESALETGIDFIARRAGKSFPSKDLTSVADLIEAKELITKE